VFRSSVPKFEAFKSWRALLVPLLTLVTVAVTGWMQSSQLARTGEANDGNREDGARPAEYETIDTDQATGARDTGASTNLARIRMIVHHQDREAGPELT